MKTILNKTRKPIRLRLPGGKTLFLGALRQAQVRDQAVDHASLKKLIEAGDVEVVGGGGPVHGAGGGVGVGKGGAAQAQTGGRGKLQTGDR